MMTHVSTTPLSDRSVKGETGKDSRLPLDQMPADFVDLQTAVPEARFDVRYFGSDNFLGTPVDGYDAPRCLLTSAAARAVKGVAEAAREKGAGLLIFDCYRPARAVAHFTRWAADRSDQRMKAQYYPEVAKQDLFAEGYLAARSSHSRGSTLDLTLFDRESGRELDMGTPFDLFSRRSWPSSLEVSPSQRANRILLADLMVANGFIPFETEWWHFTLAHEPHPDTYYDFPIR